MQNIEIRRKASKRSIESLIEDSAIDHSYHQEVQQIRKTFNEATHALNIRNEQQQKEIEKLNLMIRQHEELRDKYETKMRRLYEQLQQQKERCRLSTEDNGKMKKQLQQTQYRLDQYVNNRLNVPQQIEQESESQMKQKIKKEVFSSLSRIIAKKVESFTNEIKKLPVSRQAEAKLEQFLEELILINPYSELKFPGKKEPEHDQEMGRFQRSLQKLRNASANRVIQKPSKQIERSPNRLSPKKRRLIRLFD